MLPSRSWVPHRFDELRITPPRFSAKHIRKRRSLLLPWFVPCCVGSFVQSNILASPQALAPRPKQKERAKTPVLPKPVKKIHVYPIPHAACFICVFQNAVISAMTRDSSAKSSASLKAPTKSTQTCNASLAKLRFKPILLLATSLAQPASRPDPRSTRPPPKPSATSRPASRPSE